MDQPPQSSMEPVEENSAPTEERRQPRPRPTQAAQPRPGAAAATSAAPTTRPRQRVPRPVVKQADRVDYPDAPTYDFGDTKPKRRSNAALSMALIGLVGALLIGVSIIIFMISSGRGGTGGVPAGTSDIANTGSTAKGANPELAPTTAITAQPDNRPGRFVPEEGKDHVNEGTPIAYKSYPPSSGTHYASTGDYGFHEDEVPEGELVHNMEHGAIVLYYQPGLQADTLRQLRDAYASFPPAKYGKVKMVVTPYSRLQTPIAIAAWSRVQPFSSYDHEGLLRFYQAFVDKGPEDVP